MDLIKLAFGDYPQYEELLLRKDKFEKEAFHWYEEYIRVFGKYLIDLFEAKIECIRLKKLIAFTQAEINKGLKPDREAIDALVNIQMQSYYEELKTMIKDHENSKMTETIPLYHVEKIKKIYREIAKVLHPDINPETAKDPVLKDIWNEVVTAYKCNDLERIEELQVLANKALNDRGFDKTSIVIENIGEKIKKLEEQINQIITTDPYNYKFLLEDAEEKNQRIKDLVDQTNEFKRYQKELEKILEDLLTGD